MERRARPRDNSLNERAFIIYSLLSLVASFVLFSILFSNQNFTIANDEEVSPAVVSDKKELCEIYTSAGRKQFLLKSERDWYLSDYSTGTDEGIFLTISRYLPAADLNVELIDTSTETAVKMRKVDVNKYVLDPLTFEKGRHSLRAKISNDCFERFSDTVTVNISEPIMVVWTQDWEGFDVYTQYLNDISRISSQYKVPITHFWNPRIYINGVMSSSRAKSLDSWIKTRRDKYGDEIGLHLHMFYDLLQEVGLESHGKRWGQRTDGYDILTGEYSVSDMKRLLNWSSEQFVKRGFETPNIYRAGGWFASVNTLKALDQVGFEIDLSGREAYKIGSFQQPGYWGLDVTSQPYHPAEYDQNKSDPHPDKNLSLWEMPNNGGNTWEHPSEEIINRFVRNYPGGIANEKKVFVMLSHPHWHNVDGPKLDEIFTYIERSTYKYDKGPVVYVTTSEALEIWVKTTD